MRYRFIKLSIICSCLFLTACFPGNQSSRVNKSVNHDSVFDSGVLTSSKQNLHISITSDKLLSYRQIKAWTNIKAQDHNWNYELIESLFADRIQPNSKELYSSGNGCKWNLTDGGAINCSPGSLTYRSQIGDQLHSYLWGESDFYTPSFEQAQYGTELDSYSKEDAISDAKKAIESLGISVGDKYVISTLDTDTMNRIYDARYASANRDELKEVISKENEAYRVCFTLQPDGFLIIPSEPKYYDANQEILSSGELTIIINQTGILYLECRNYMDIDSSEKKEAAICSASDALLEIKSNLEKTALIEETYLDDIIFGYSIKVITNEQFELVPMWNISAYEVDTNGNAIANPMFVNPMTGKER